MLPWLAYCISHFCLKRLKRLSLRACRSSFSRFRLAEDKIVLNDIFWQLGPSLFVLRHFFLLGMDLGLDMKWTGVAKFFGPIITSQNPVVRLLGRRGGFWCPRAYVTVSQVLSSGSARASSSAQGMLLALWYTRRAVINAFMERCGSLRYTRRTFISAFMKWRRSNGWGFPWKLGETYFACNSLFEFRAN